jgi:hypothetical protein
VTNTGKVSEKAWSYLSKTRYLNFNDISKQHILIPPPLFRPLLIIPYLQWVILFSRRFVSVLLLTFIRQIMVQHITDLIKEYQAKVCQLPFRPKASFHRDSMGYCCDVNKFFLAFLFCDHSTGVNFLKDVGIIRSEVQCNLCGRNMTWYAEPSVSDGFRWRCRRSVHGTRCSGARSIRHGSWFLTSNLTFHEALCLTYDILRCENDHHIQHEHHFSRTTIADWGMFCIESMVVLLEGCSEKVGCPN